MCLAAAPASATVFEYGPNGARIVNGERDGAAAAAPAPSVSTRGPVRGDAASYRDLAHRIALRHAGGQGPRRAGLDAVTFARLFVELVRAESAFEPRAVSSKGAQGLGQLMPATAEKLGVRAPFDPAVNLDGAARYLAAQLARFGSVPLALAAYNAGPEAVVEHGGVPPYPETRAYVAKITATLKSEQSAAPAAAPSQATAAAPPPSRSGTNGKEPSVWEY